MARLLLAVGSIAFALLLPPRAFAQSPAPESRERFQVASIVVGVDYPARHTLYAFGGQAGCAEGKSCALLLRSTNGGGSWFDMPASGWTGQPVMAVRFGPKELLVAPGKDGIEVSEDGGMSFRSHKLPVAGHTIDAASRPNETLDVLVSGSEPQHLFTLPAGRVAQIPGSSLAGAMLWFNPRYPEVPRGETHAFAAGHDRSTGFSVVERCDARLACSKGSVVGSQKSSIARLAISPGLNADRTLFAITVSGLFRSGDGGNTFVPVAVAPTSSETVISTVQAIAFTSDFSASTRAGRVFAAVLSVTRATSGPGGTISGGIFESKDGLTWSKVGEQSALDGGASAVAVAPDGRVFAGYVNPQGGRIMGGILCTADRKVWRPSCPTYASSSALNTKGTGGGSKQSSAKDAAKDAKDEIPVLSSGDETGARSLSDTDSGGRSGGRGLGRGLFAALALVGVAGVGGVAFWVKVWRRGQGG